MPLGEPSAYHEVKVAGHALGFDPHIIEILGWAHRLIVAHQPLRRRLTNRLLAYAHRRHSLQHLAAIGQNATAKPGVHDKCQTEGGRAGK